MTDIIVALVVLAVLGAAIGYIIYAKKHGAKCIGCPSGNRCSGQCSGCGGSCGCGAQAQPVKSEIVRLLSHALK